MSSCKASEIPRNEAYIEVHRSASGPEGLRPGGTRDEGNAADGRFPTASKGREKKRIGRIAHILFQRQNNGKALSCAPW
jgi:hypothetical protein